MISNSRVRLSQDGDDSVCKQLLQERYARQRKKEPPIILHLGWKYGGKTVKKSPAGFSTR